LSQQALNLNIIILLLRFKDEVNNKAHVDWNNQLKNEHSLLSLLEDQVLLHHGLDLSHRIRITCDLRLV